MMIPGGVEGIPHLRRRQQAMQSEGSAHEILPLHVHRGILGLADSESWKKQTHTVPREVQ